MRRSIEFTRKRKYSELGERIAFDVCSSVLPGALFVRSARAPGFRAERFKPFPLRRSRSVWTAR